MQHMSEIGMTFEPVICYYSAKVGNANLRLSGFAVSDDTDQLDLFVSLYDGVSLFARSHSLRRNVGWVEKARSGRVQASGA